MSTDLMIGLTHRPGTLADACEALGRAGINIEGAFGLVVDGRPDLHLLVEDAELATRTLIDGGFEILAHRQVLAVSVENTPGAGGRMLRRVADAGVSVELMYTTLDGRLVLATDDMARLRAALAGPA